MDVDSSAKFIGSLTKFLQSLCNGYVEFQKGVELVGHIYLNIDTGEKVDYILHERVSKNDENSVSFVSNSFHAQPNDKKEESGQKDRKLKRGNNSEGASDDDDIVIMDQTERIPGSGNTGTVPNKVFRRSHMPGFDNRHASVRRQNQGSSSSLSSQSNFRQQQYGSPQATVSSQSMQQDNISMGDVKLEQLSADELLSLASQVDHGGPSSASSHAPSEGGQQSRIKQGSQELNSSAGQPVWIKQEAPDDSSQAQGGHDQGWPHNRDGQSDSSNSGSDLYPIMMHSNAAYPSGSVFPGFPSSSGQSGSFQPDHSQGFPAGMDPYANPGSSQGMDPTEWPNPSGHAGPSRLVSSARRPLSNAELCRRYRARLRQDPERHHRQRVINALRCKRYRENFKRMSESGQIQQYEEQQHLLKKF